MHVYIISTWQLLLSDIFHFSVLSYWKCFFFTINWVSQLSLLSRCAEFTSHEIVSLAFSHDSKYLLAQGGPPDFQLVYFFWEKGKVITSSKTGGCVTEVSFHPKDHDIVCIVGRAIFRMCRLIEGQGELLSDWEIKILEQKLIQHNSQTYHKS